ncbi:hypothetical protein J6590_084919 [Homalodisca vitripennis]|nr:hypothetical protein J6590_084919 [Homalodisca vitripennis]
MRARRGKTVKIVYMIEGQRDRKERNKGIDEEEDGCEFGEVGDFEGKLREGRRDTTERDFSLTSSYLSFSIREEGRCRSIDHIHGLKYKLRISRSINNCIHI